MPQASAELREKFPGYDQEAIAVISENFNDKAGMITPKSEDYKMTERESEAINYLCDEWDYSYLTGYGLEADAIS
jgi:hypothetical protein